MAHVTRGTEKLQILKEPPKSKDYDWVCQTLHSATGGGERCSLNIVDTVLLAGARPVTWLFTSKSGLVMKKGENKLRLETIVMANVLFEYMHQIVTSLRGPIRST